MSTSKADLDGPLTIRDLVDEAYSTALSKGWYEGEEPSVGLRLALVHSEISEALEEWRKGHPVGRVYYVERTVPGQPAVQWGQQLKAEPMQKPEGFAIELADAVIRIADLCGRHGIDLEAAIKTKLQYNKTRPHRHGGKIA